MITRRGSLSLGLVLGGPQSAACRVLPQFGVSIDEVKKVQETAKQTALDDLKAAQQKFLMSSQATLNGQKVTGEEILDLVDQKIKSIGFLRRYHKVDIVLDSLFTVISGGIILLAPDIRKTFFDHFKPSLPSEELSALLETFEPLPDTRCRHIDSDLHSSLMSLDLLDRNYGRCFLTPTGLTALKARRKRISQ